MGDLNNGVLFDSDSAENLVRSHCTLKTSPTPPDHGFLFIRWVFHSHNFLLAFIGTFLLVGILLNIAPYYRKATFVKTSLVAKKGNSFTLIHSIRDDTIMALIIKLQSTDIYHVIAVVFILS